MSRTRKDRPSWVQEADPVNRKKALVHHHCGARWVPIKFKEVECIRYEYKYTLTGFIDWNYYRAPKVVGTRMVAVLWASEYVACDMYEKSVRVGMYNSKDCSFRPLDRDSWDWASYYGIDQSQRKAFHRSVRGEGRMITKRMTDQYNASGELDDYVFTPLRKNALFGGGYLD